MHIDVIDTFDGLKRLEADWDAVYAADSESHFFLSRTWLWKWLGELKEGWQVLAAKPSAEAASYDAFFPIRFRTKQAKGGGFYNEIAMAGNRQADYTGLLCRPGAEERAIPAFARHIRTLNWTFLHLEGFRVSDARIGLLSRPFADGQFVGREKDPINPDGINNAICPLVELPGSFEAYMAGLSRNGRSNVRAVLRTLDAGGDIRVTHATAETFERDLDLLMRLWSARWASAKGTNLQAIINTTAVMLRHCFQQNALFMPVLWQGDTPVTVHASYIDRQKQAYLFVLQGRDDSFNRAQPGRTLMTHSIRYAISQGIKTFDFCRGNESYKYSFGVKEHRLKYITIATADRRNLGGRLAPATLPEVLRQSVILLKDGKTAEAEIGLRQVLQSDPDHHQARSLYERIQVARREEAARAGSAAMAQSNG